MVPAFPAANLLMAFQIMRQKAIGKAIRNLLFIFACLFSINTVGCSTSEANPQTDLEIRIPKQSDWIDYGTIFEAGKEGDWDRYLWGGFTGTAVKKDDTYYLYYQGARDYLGAPYETVIWRTIGVATTRPQLLHLYGPDTIWA